jgi:DNA modification methylase
LEIVYLSPHDLKPYEGNTRKHAPDDIDQIKASIEADGFNDPIGIWGEENLIVEGHGRQIAALEMGLEKVPCIRLDHMTETQRRDYAIRHNRTAELSGWDYGKLEEEIAALEIEGVDLSGLKFDLDALNGGGNPEIDIVEDEPPEPPETAIAKLGDIWQLGRHRLMCGDSTSKADMDKLMAGTRPLFVFTDPPYGVSIGDKNALLKKHQGGKSNAITENIIGDTLVEKELRQMLVKAMSNLREHCDEGASYYVSAPQGGSLGLMMMMMMRDAGLEVRHNLIWVKNCATFSLGRLDYDYQHEPIFYTWTKKHIFYGGYSTTVIDDSKPIDKMSKAELKEMVRALTEQHPQSVIYEDKPLKCNLHPTMKPVKLVARFMINSSQQGDPVADIFGGSGTTLMAAEQTGRDCYMMELDPHYVDVIIQRWENFTGEKAVLLNDAT